MPTFSLEISLTTPFVGRVKHDLARLLPMVKSSHRAEAMARGLGFATHAALLAAIESGAVRSTPPLTRVDATPFVAFLSSRGYSVDAPAFYRCCALVAIREVMDREPALTAWGYRVGRPRRKADGKIETVQELHARFQDERSKMLSDGSADQFLRALVLIQMLKPIKSINTRTSSYNLKHRAENLPSRYPDGSPLGPLYVSNGMLMAAALHVGYRYKTSVDDLGYTSITVAFNLSQTAIDDVLAVYDPSRLTETRLHRAQKRSARGTAALATGIGASAVGEASRIFTLA